MTIAGAILLSALGFLIGTLIGAGGGFLLVPILLLGYHLPPATAVGTSLSLVFLNATSGSVAYLRQRRVDRSVAASGERRRERWSTALVELTSIGPGQWRLRQRRGIRPFTSTDPDSARVWWEDAGVHQNLIFPVHPDPVSGQHCWHQKVTVARPGAEDRYGDVFVDTNRAYEVYREWLKLARPAPGPGGLRGGHSGSCGRSSRTLRRTC